MITLGEVVFTVIIVAAIVGAYFLGKEVGTVETNKMWLKYTEHAAKIRERESRRAA